MSRKWKASYPDYKMLVTADEDGSAVYYPFVANSKHEGEKFWIAGYSFVVRSDNGIHLPEEFMEKYGYIRSDGKRALILESFGKYYPLKYKGREYGTGWEEVNEWLEKLAPVDPETGKRYVQGARMWYGLSIEKYYSETNGDVLLIKQRDYEDLLYVSAFRKTKTMEGGWMVMHTKTGYAYWYHPHFLITPGEKFKCGGKLNESISSC